MKFWGGFFLLFSINIWAADCAPNLFTLCRNDAGRLKLPVSRSIENQVEQYRKNIKLLENLKEVVFSVKIPISAKDFYGKISVLTFFQEGIKQCLNSIENEGLNCSELELRKVLSVLVKENFIDTMSGVIIHNELITPKNFKKKIITLTEYTNRLMFLKSKSKGGDCFACGIKKIKFHKLRGLTLNQFVLLKYNYLQLSRLNKISKTLSKRIESVQSGFFFDYDGDGENDEVELFDPAEQYRFSVKLLKRDLAQQSQTGELLAGKKPTASELLAAASLFGEIDDDILKMVMELPFLEDEEIPRWKKALRVAERIAKNAIMLIPGVNIYAAIPIIALESFRELRRKENENSDLHLFTF